MVAEEEGRTLSPEYASNVLVVMARGSVSGLWRAAGGPVRVDELALSDELRHRLGDWSEALRAAIGENEDVRQAELLERYTREGLGLARCVQDALGDAYDVLFFDEARLAAEAYLTDYLYPVRTAS